MRLDLLLESLAQDMARDRMLLRRISSFFLPLLLLPVGLALTAMVFSWVRLLLGAMLVGGLLMQGLLALQPITRRALANRRDLQQYIALQPLEPPSLAPAVRLLLPALLALVLSLALGLATLGSTASTWQRLLIIALGLATLWVLWQELSRVANATLRLDTSLVAARQQLNLRPTPVPTALNAPWPRLQWLYRAPRASQPPAEPANDPPALPRLRYGLLEPAIAQRVGQLPMPVLRLSPAAQALLRTEAYLLLREAPARDEYELLAALGELANDLYQQEQRHSQLPPVGGKIYLPITHDGPLAAQLRATVRGLGLDGAYSATLGTWLIRLPPARSYQVAGRLIDAVIALQLLPPGQVLPHHLTVQGNLSDEAKLLSLLYLAATPLVFSQRPGHASGDERPFLMSGGGILDDMDGRGRYNGPRTDFVDGFLIANIPELREVEHVVGHSINLRVKQVLAFGLHATQVAPSQRRPTDQAAALAYQQASTRFRSLLDAYALAGALDVAWLDGRWQAVWPFIEQMSQIKQQVPAFLEAAQAIRDEALDAVEAIAVRAAPRA